MTSSIFTLIPRFKITFALILLLISSQTLFADQSNEDGTRGGGTDDTGQLIHWVSYGESVACHDHKTGSSYVVSCTMTDVACDISELCFNPINARSYRPGDEFLGSYSF
jgi:hypothetical protein